MNNPNELTNAEIIAAYGERLKLMDVLHNPDFTVDLDGMPVKEIVHPERIQTICQEGDDGLDWRFWTAVVVMGTGLFYLMVCLVDAVNRG